MNLVHNICCLFGFSLGVPHCHYSSWVSNIIQDPHIINISRTFIGVKFFLQDFFTFYKGKNIIILIKVDALIKAFSPLRGSFPSVSRDAFKRILGWE